MQTNHFSSAFSQMMLANPEADVQSTLMNLGSMFGMSHFTYFVEPHIAADISTVEVHSSYSTPWREHYAANNYHMIDPVIAEGMSGFLPFDWSALSRRRKSVKTFFGEAAEFGIHRNGISIPTRDPAMGRGLFSACFDVSNKEWTSYGPSIIGDLTYLAFLAHDAFSRSARGCQSGHEAEDDDVTLTTSEIDVLRWAGHGKTAWETSGIMATTERTVVYHLKNACKKLGVVNKTHAVARCISEGYFFVRP